MCKEDIAGLNSLAGFAIDLTKERGRPGNEVGTLPAIPCSPYQFLSRCIQHICLG